MPCHAALQLHLLQRRQIGRQIEADHVEDAEGLGHHRGLITGRAGRYPTSRARRPSSMVDQKISF
jgi:hypothetical protein